MFNIKKSSDITEEQREAVRLASQKYRNLERYVQNLAFQEAADISITKDDFNFKLLNMVDVEDIVYGVIMNQYARKFEGRSIDIDPAEADELNFEDISDTLRAVRTNRLNLAQFDTKYEQAMVEGVFISDYLKARDMCPMTLSEYMIAEIEVCQALRPVCKTGFTLSFYVRSGCDVKVFKFSEDEVVALTDKVYSDMLEGEEYYLMKCGPTP